jgi:hypothetical protein
MKYFQIILWVVMSYQLVAQDTTFLKKISIEKPIALSIDKQQNIFLADEKGNIFKYDSSGKQVLRYAPEKIGLVNSLEAWQRQQIFVFYQEFQEYLFLDRFLNPTSRQKFPFESVGFAQTATISANHQIWLFDAQDFSIKKFDPQLQQVLIHTSLDLILDAATYDMVWMREYQNRLFLVDAKNGILLFDNLGNYQQTLAYTGVQYLSFKEDKIFFVKDNQLFEVDIYTLEEKKNALPSISNLLYVVPLENKTILISDQQLIFVQK